jgi:hypothetical protein
MKTVRLGFTGNEEEIRNVLALYAKNNGWTEHSSLSTSEYATDHIWKHILESATTEAGAELKVSITPEVADVV